MRRERSCAGPWAIRLSCCLRDSTRTPHPIDFALPSRSTSATACVQDSIGSSRSPEGCCWWPSTRQSTAGRRGMIVKAIEEGVHTMTAMSLPSPPPEWAQFTLGPLTIHTYALCLIAGMIAATVYTQRRLSGRGAEKAVVLDIVLWAIPLGKIGRAHV